MMEIISRYSGICAIVVYSLLLWIILSISSRKKNRKVTAEKQQKTVTRSANPLDESDEDALVAALVAAIEGRNEWHKNVRIVSVREVKA